MRRVVLTFTTAALCLVPAHYVRAGEGSLASLVAAERSFAAASVATSTREAFLANLATDSILFRPYAVPGVAWTESHPGGNGLLTWEPTFATVSGSGDMGFTTGPWEYRKGRSLDEVPIAYGHFATVWQVRDNGNWRVAIDCGVSHAKSGTAEPLVLDDTATYQAAAVKASTPTGAARESLVESESAFSRILGQDGVESAYGNTLADGARVYRDDKMPAVGRQGALELARADGSAVNWTSDGAATSSLGDLGYTFGRGKRAGAKQGTSDNYTFLRIWRRTGSGPWKIVLEVVNGVPDATSGN